jgi:hypothetical protein
MENKYTIAADKTGSHRIDVTLVSCEIETADAGMQTVNYGFATATVSRLTVKTTLTINVRAEANGNVTEEEIVAVGEVTGNAQSLSTGQASISIALEGSILLMDRFLDKAFGKTSAVEDEPADGIQKSDI